MAKLLVKEGPGKGDTFELSQAEITLGRDPENTVRMDDRTVSRIHARITERNGRYFVTDLESHNGTVVNGARVGRSRLSHMDEIRLGNAVLLFLEDDVADVDLLLQSSDKGAEITQTISVEDPPALTGASGESRSELSVSNRKLLALTELSQAATKVRSLPTLFDLLTDSVKRALDPDRVVPMVRQDDERLLPYIRDRSGFAKGLEAVAISTATVRHSVKNGVAVLSQARPGAAQAAGRSPPTSAMCVPLKTEHALWGVIYCDRLNRPDRYERTDLQYLCSLAAPVAVAMENIREYERIAARARDLEREVAGRYDLLGRSPRIEAVFEFIRKAAPTEASVLICGESGTGKELVARAIHYHGPRRNGPFEAVNCAAMSPSLIESELFGHVKGAFTGAINDRPGRFELAHRGAIFLDEIGALPLECQTKLLRVLETGTLRRVGDVKDRRVDVRVIAATNQDIAASMEQGRFRDDLFYRVNVLRADLPPLRELGDDVELLAHHFLRRFGQQCGRTFKGFHPKVLAAFRRYRWPGNVRELKNLVERMVIMCEDDVVGEDLLPPELRDAPAPAAQAPQPAESQQDLRSLQEVEKQHILAVLRSANDNKKRAAEILGVDRSTLYAKLKRYGLRQ